jgi:hypothetical protein
MAEIGIKQQARDRSEGIHAIAFRSSLWSWRSSDVVSPCISSLEPFPFAMWRRWSDGPLVIIR